MGQLSYKSRGGTPRRKRCSESNLRSAVGKPLKPSLFMGKSLINGRRLDRGGAMHGNTEVMKVGDLMRRWFDRLESGTPVLEAARVMVLTGQQALPVVEDDRLVGMIAERDILARLLGELSADVYQGLSFVDRDALGCYRHLCTLPVDDLMSRRLVTIAPDVPALNGVGVMRARRIQRLPVIEAGELVGVVFQQDIHAALLGVSIRQPHVT